MSARTLSSRAPRWLALAAAALVPLALVGFVAGAIGQSDDPLERIPAAVVNEDELIVVTDGGGGEQFVFAGRQLVTELVGADGFDWQVSNAERAAELLATGDVYAVLTVPADFSESVLSLSGENPRRAEFTIRTDDAHSYLSGSVAQSVGDAMTTAFGREITAQYISGLTSGLGELGAALGDAADGATALSGGAASLTAGVTQYANGVDQLAGGLGELSDGAAGLGELEAAIAQYTGSVSQLSATLSSIAPGIQAQLTDAMLAGTLQAVVDGLAQAAAGGPSLSGQSSTAFAGIRSGIDQSADGAWQLAQGSPELVSGAASLGSGAQELAAGLREGAALVPAQGEANDAIDVATDPVSYTVTTDNEVTDARQGLATLFVPLGLWVGALATLLVLRPASRGALASSATDGRLARSALARASAVALVQALLLVALLHGAFGVAWSLLPATIGIAVVAALAFTAVHLLLRLLLGRGGLVLSILLFALQLAATGGIYPAELLAGPFRAVSPYLPLTWAVNAMQGVIAGGAAGPVLGGVAALAALGTVASLLAVPGMRRLRTAKVLGLVPGLT